MTEEQKQVSWAEAVQGGNFIKLETEEMKNITIKNWKLVEVEKEFNGNKETKVEFTSVCIEEDGETVDKIFNTSSNRLKMKLRAVLEKLDALTPVKLSIIKIGEKFSTNYSCKLVQ